MLSLAYPTYRRPRGAHHGGPSRSARRLRIEHLRAPLAPLRVERDHVPRRVPLGLDEPFTDGLHRIPCFRDDGSVQLAAEYLDGERFWPACGHVRFRRVSFGSAAGRFVRHVGRTIGLVFSCLWGSDAWNSSLGGATSGMTTLSLDAPCVRVNRREPALPHHCAMTTLRRPWTPRQGVLAVRPACAADVPRLVEMNHAHTRSSSRPTSSERGAASRPPRALPEDSSWPPRRRAMGAISTFIVPRRAIRWRSTPGSTSPTTARSPATTPAGYALPRRRVCGPGRVGQARGDALYGALRDTCVSLGLRRVVAGGRLWGYHEYAGVMTAQEYVDAALRGDIRDRVLGSSSRPASPSAASSSATCAIHEPRLRDAAGVGEASLSLVQRGRDGEHLDVYIAALARGSTRGRGPFTSIGGPPISPRGPPVDSEDLP